MNRIYRLNCLIRGLGFGVWGLGFGCRVYVRQCRDFDTVEHLQALPAQQGGEQHTDGRQGRRRAVLHHCPQEAVQSPPPHMGLLPRYTRLFPYCVLVTFCSCPLSHCIFVTFCTCTTCAPGFEGVQRLFPDGFKESIKRSRCSHTSRVTRHTSHVTRHASRVTLHCLVSQTVKVLV